MASRTPEQRGPFGRALLKAREATKPLRTQGQIAEELGTSQGTVCSWESGETLPRAERIDEIAGAYGLRPDRLRSLWFAVASKAAA